MSLEQQLTITDLGIMPRDRLKQLARWISNIFSPPVFGFAGLLLVAQTQQSLSGWLWIIFYIGIAVFIPVLYVLWLLRTQQITDFHIKLRHQRLRPMLAMLMCSLLAWGIMLVGSAPVLLQTIAIMGAVLMMILLVITLRWKISGHTTAVTVFSVFGVSLWGSLAIPILLLIPIIIWARVVLKRHSLTQTFAGVALGGLFFLLVHSVITLQCGGVMQCG
jgi:membrane-associated phospholipid phosphatase